MKTQDKHILIVGGASGIGRAAAEMLLARDCEPFVADKHKEKLDACTHAWGGRCKPFVLDIADPVNVKSFFQSMTEEKNSLDAVVMTAAIHSCHPIEYLPDHMIDTVININLVAHIKFIRDVIPFIRDGGRIIAISSVSGGIGIPMEGMYSASKAGLEIFYECLDTELSYKNIRCSIIQPGNVNTGFNETGNYYESNQNRFVDGLYQTVVERTESKYGMPPNAVAKNILKAIYDKNPKLCYVTGMNAMKAHWAKRLLGRELAVKMIAKLFAPRRVAA